MVWRALAAVVFPAECPGCGSAAEPVCEACAAGLRPPLPAPPPPGVDAWVAPFAYEGVARELVARVKYRHTRASVPWLASAVAAAVRSLVSPASLDVVSWTPTTGARRRDRGFDHARMLAAATGDRLGLPVRSTLVRRPGPPQTGLAGAARRRGPGFVARTRPVPARILLVDDVATTGATLAEAAGALRRAGARLVVAATAARTPAGLACGSHRA